MNESMNIAASRAEDQSLRLERPAFRMRAVIAGREAWIVSLLLLGASGIGAWFLYRADRYAFLYFGDGVSHLTIARLFVDSRVPGIHNIGTVWLPLPHLLFLPLSLIDGLFYTGIAGLIIGIPCLAGTAVLLFSVIEHLTRSRPIALLCALLFGLNPNMVYMALTPMTELPLLFFVTLGASAFLAWLDTGGERFLFLCTAAVVCASLCRYEAWLCVPFVSIAALMRARDAFAEKFSARALKAAAAGIGVWMGIILWLAWNMSEYGDAMKFAHWTHWIAADTAPAIRKQDPFEIVLLIGRAIRAVYGPVLLILGAIALLRHGRRRLEDRALSVLVFLALPGVFALAAIIAGYAQIDEWRWNWRYMLTLSPFFAVAGAIGVQALFSSLKPRAARAAIVLGALAIPVIQVTMPDVGVSTYIDAKKGFVDETQYAKNAGELLMHSGVSGSVALLTPYREAKRIMISSGLPLKTFHLIYAPNDEDLFKPLWPDEQFIVIGKQPRPESSRLVDYWLERRTQLLVRYAAVSEDDYYLILKRHTAENPSQKQDHPGN